MSETVESLILEQFRRTHGRSDKLGLEIGDVESRLIMLEATTASFSSRIATVEVSTATVSQRTDRIESRLDGVERRAERVETH